MNIDFQNLVELMKTEYNESGVRVEKNLVQENYTGNESQS